MNRRDFMAVTGATLVAPVADTLAAGAAAVDFDPTERSVDALQQALASRAVSSAALTSAYLERIARYDQAGPTHRSVLALNPDALGDARTLDAERRAGRIRGAWHGVPVLIKDNIETAGRLPATAGSLALARSTHTVDAPLVARLRAAGALILGKANLSEWANFRSQRSSSGWSALGGQTGNAYASDRNPSGSSSGSAVAAALSLCAIAIGTETNGSILSPSSLNGLVGLKPTKGLVSGDGIVPISPRQDTAGPMGRTVADVAALAAVIAERPLGFGAYGTGLEQFRLRGVRIGAMPLTKTSHPAVARLYEQARSVLEREGAVVIDHKPPAAFEELGEAEFEALLYEFKASLNDYLAAQDPSRVPSRTLADLIAFNEAHAKEELSEFGQDIFELAEARGPLTDAVYLKALATLARCADVEGLAALLARERVDVLIELGNGPAERIDHVWGDRRTDGNWSAIASAAAIAGYPSLTVPVGLARGLPVGLTLVAPRFQDGLLLQVGRAYERAGNARVAPRLAG